MAAMADNGTPDTLTSAALYVRMSTASQELSPQVQEALLRRYAAANALEVVRVYLDAGCSGVTVRGRRGLQRLLADVAGGDLDFQVLLVYDVSRWGRYQDVDEAGFYEFCCRTAGIQVVYCGEQFANDGSPLSQLLKNIKRAMAAEYSRELSEKVFEAQYRLASLGFKQGGAPTYGLRRIAVSCDGGTEILLGRGERKPHKTDRVRLAPGDQVELTIIQRIFELYTRDGLTIRAIVRLLNGDRVPCCGGVWTDFRVAGVLGNAQYRGLLIYNRRCSRLQSSVTLNPSTQWARKEGALKAIVSPEMGDKADRIRRMRNGDDAGAVMDAILAVYAKHGTVTQALLATEPGMPGRRRLARMFGSVSSAYEQAGVPDYRRRPTLLSAALQNSLRRALVQRVQEMALLAGAVASLVPGAPDHVFLDGRCKVRITVAACRQRPTGLRWRVMARDPTADFVLAGLLDEANVAVAQYAVISAHATGPEAVYFGSGRYAKSRLMLVNTLEELFGLPPGGST